MKKNKNKKVIVFNKGVWNATTVLSFNTGLGGSSNFLETNTQPVGNVVQVPVVALDEIAECQNATFIKMDVEGSEQKALEGAKKIITKNRPILAICIYHSDSDMINVPDWIIENCPNYKYYVRQHTPFWNETVFYAVPCELNE